MAVELVPLVPIEEVDVADAEDMVAATAGTEAVAEIIPKANTPTPSALREKFFIRIV